MLPAIRSQLPDAVQRCETQLPLCPWSLSLRPTSVGRRLYRASASKSSAQPRFVVSMPAGAVPFRSSSSRVRRTGQAVVQRELIYSRRAAQARMWRFAGEVRPASQPERVEHSHACSSGVQQRRESPCAWRGKAPLEPSPEPTAELPLLIGRGHAVVKTEDGQIRTSRLKIGGIR